MTHEYSSERVAAIAARVLRDPLATEDAKALAGSALTQAPNNNPTATETAIRAAVADQAEALDGQRYRALRNVAVSGYEGFVEAMIAYGAKNFADFNNPTADEFDAAVDFARLKARL